MNLNDQLHFAFSAHFVTDNLLINVFKINTDRRTKTKSYKTIREVAITTPRPFLIRKGGLWKGPSCDLRYNNF